MFLDATKFISRGEGVVLTTPLPPLPPASSMVRLPKHPARNPSKLRAADGMWRAVMEGTPSSSPSHR